MKFSKNKLQKIIDEELKAVLLERDALGDVAFDAGQETLRHLVRQGVRPRLGLAAAGAAGALAGGLLGVLYPDEVADGTIKAANERQFGLEAMMNYIGNHHPEIKNPERLAYRILAYQDIIGVSAYDFMRDKSRGEKSGVISKVKDIKNIENDFKIIKKLRKDFDKKVVEASQKQDLSNKDVKKSFFNYVNEVREMLEKDFNLTAHYMYDQRKQKQDAVPQLTMPRRPVRKAPYQPDALYEYIKKKNIDESCKK